MQAVHAAITAAGARCLDAGMFSPPPGGGVHGRLFVSGPGAEALSVFATPDLSVRVLSERIGDASALKMCDAVISKGVTALVLQMLIAAERLGVAQRTRGAVHAGAAQDSRCRDRRAAGHAVRNPTAGCPRCWKSPRPSMRSA